MSGSSSPKPRPHPDHANCSDPMPCPKCGERDCPYTDGLHYHPGGCPSCGAPDDVKLPDLPMLQESDLTATGPLRPLYMPSLHEKVERILTEIGVTAMYVNDAHLAPFYDELCSLHARMGVQTGGETSD